MKWGSAAPLEQARASGFEFAISRFESSRPSQPVRCAEKMSLSLGERPANGGLSRITHESPGHSRSEIADSLRQAFEKLPFFGRLQLETGSDLHSVAKLAVKRCQILCYGRRQIGSAEPALPPRMPASIAP
jgi:hypothetical protein